jgi:hypothetical protein
LRNTMESDGPLQRWGHAVRAEVGGGVDEDGGASGELLVEEDVAEQVGYGKEAVGTQFDDHCLPWPLPKEHEWSGWGGTCEFARSRPSVSQC